MHKHVELPLLEPLYSTYHYQAPGTAAIVNNPSIRNWYLNMRMNLSCTRKFLSGYTSPQVTIEDTFWSMNPHLERLPISTRFTKGYINPIIRELLDNGYYVPYSGVDDYYVEGKTWYKERHFSHDGMICGYDQEEKTYCIYAYDSNWVYRKFWTPQKGFNAGRVAMEKKGFFGGIYGMKPKVEPVAFSPKTACSQMKGYLASDIETYPFDGEGVVYGIIVHAYIAEYIAKLYRGEIPYERMDRRVFRVIWEHKKAMLERMILIEQSLGADSELSTQYAPLVSEADTMRMLYASHRMKRRNSVLPIIQKKVLSVMEKENELLTLFVEKMGKELANEPVEISEK